MAILGYRKWKTPKILKSEPTWLSCYKLEEMNNLSHSPRAWEVWRKQEVVPRSHKEANAWSRRHGSNQQQPTAAALEKYVIALNRILSCSIPHHVCRFVDQVQLMLWWGMDLVRNIKEATTADEEELWTRNFLNSPFLPHRHLSSLFQKTSSRPFHPSICIQHLYSPHIDLYSLCT